MVTIRATNLCMSTPKVGSKWLRVFMRLDVLSINPQDYMHVHVKWKS